MRCQRARQQEETQTRAEQRQREDGDPGGRLHESQHAEDMLLLQPEAL